jgi:hypothetical protein
VQQWQVRRLNHGGINQAGVPQHEGPAWDDTRGAITRAVVLKTYYADDKIWDDRAWAKGNVRGVCCDLRTYGRKSTPLWKVPVLQRTHGLHDEDIYIPRESTQDIAGAGANLVTLPSGKDNAKPTPAENLDGDHVLVGFLEGNPDAPVILPFCLPHPSSSRTLKAAGGRVKRLRHAGVMIEWSEDGNLTIDASSATTEKLGNSGAEVSNSGTGGVVTIKTQDGAGAISSMVLDANGGIKFLDGGGSFLELTKATGTAELSANFVKLATGPRQPVLKGTDFNAAETAFYNTGILAAVGAALTLVNAAMAEIAKGQNSQKADIWIQGTPGRTAIDAASASLAAFTAPFATAMGIWQTKSAAALSTKTTTG